ncbi:EthD family reductase [Spongiibacter taiwanensis]|uniref:EthD family reductase n=1 Tax=Spongiibacter taiwanensis TaxID=1748242 RepID=UPI0020354D18|nr:EthD family reductase [Spongiibacter taiwanensis]USA42567.1 EthD family reductase [Spongiibacter taiwanensis]
MNKIAVQVMYPQSEKFDWEYYIPVHMGMVQEKMKPLKWFVMKGAEGIIPPTYQAIAFMVFENQANWEAIFAQTSAELLADIPMYTDAQPTIQVSEILTPM